MSKHLFKLLFGALFLVAATAFTGCSDDDEKNEAPKLSAEPAALNFTDETALTQTVSIKANCEWEAVLSAGMADWATVTPEKTKGNATLSVTVKELPAGVASREGTISFNLTHPEYGKWGDAGVKIKVTQVSGGQVLPTQIVWEETCGTADAAAKPYVDAYTGWAKSGSGAETVTYSGTKSSVRASGLVNNGSGHNEIFFGSAPSTFVVNTITLTPEQTNLKLTFLGQRSTKLEDGSYDNTFDPSKLVVALSKDGTKWTDITYTAEGGAEMPYWVNCATNFTLSEAVTSLYIRFTASESSVIRADDFKLETGQGGTVVDLEKGNDPVNPTKKNIGEIKEAGTYETAGTVVARGKMAYIIADNTGAMMVYHKDNERTVGDKINIKGEVTVYNATSTPQFSEAAEVEVVSTGNNWSYNPTVLDAAALDALLTASPVCKEIQFEGTVAVSGDYVNVNIDGAATAVGSIKYMDNETLKPFDGSTVVIKGYFLGTSSGKFVNVLPYSVEESGNPTPKIIDVTPASLSFSAAGEAKSVGVSLNAAAQDGFLEVAVDNAQFSALVIDNTTVRVTAKENTTEASIAGTLTITLKVQGAAVDSKTVALSQAAKSQGGGDTKGIYASMDIFNCTVDTSADASYTLKNSTFNGEAASGVKLGTAKKAGFFTSQAVGVTGSKKLSFYAVAWKGKQATVYVKVNNGGSVNPESTAIAPNDGATGNPDFTITVTDSDYYTFDLSDLTAGSTITLSTSSSFSTAETDAGRAVIAGIQLY